MAKVHANIQASLGVSTCMKRETALLWFTTDLRLHDNGLLQEALNAYESVVPVYCLDVIAMKKEQWGFKRMGARRIQFLLESLQDLRSSMASLGAHLQVVLGDPSEIIPRLSQEYKVREVFAKKEVGTEELQLQSNISSQLSSLGIEWTIVSTSTLYHPNDLPFSVRDIPEVFTDFRKRAERESTIRSVWPVPEEIRTPALSPTEVPSLAELGYTVEPIDSRAVVQFVGGESKALERLQYYTFQTKLLSTYKETRNGLVGGDYSSKFSPWLAHGCLSPREIVARINEYEDEYEANDSTYWLIFELIWRDYFRFAMKKHKHHFFLEGGIQGKPPLKNKNKSKDALDRWISGNTGVDFVDANMIELRQTGFMSNRGRQVVASYLCNDLKLDWRLGAAYFEEQLIDYDVSSNWGNWAYLAGVGNDPRGNRYFDSEKQARQYDSAGAYQKLWLKSNEGLPKRTY